MDKKPSYEHISIIRNQILVELLEIKRKYEIEYSECSHKLVELMEHCIHWDILHMDGDGRREFVCKDCGLVFDYGKLNR